MAGMVAPASKSNPKKPQRGQVRIIAGQWRGSKLEVIGANGLRPTSDRVRETLFNWLQHHIVGASCIDVFAGSGALGFEAASRGVAKVMMIEREPAAMAQLRAAKLKLCAENVEFRDGDALAFLAGTPDRRFDIAFVDPPFTANLHTAALQALIPWLARDAFVYVEHAVGEEPIWPPGFTVHREGRTREARYVLLRWKIDGGVPDTLPFINSSASAP